MSGRAGKVETHHGPWPLDDHFIEVEQGNAAPQA
jgi:hypothetical protein